MRIGLVSQEYPPETAHGGIGTQTHAKAHGLAAMGHDVIVVSHSIDGRRHDYRDGAVRVTRIPGFDDRLPIQTESVRWITYSALVAGEIAALNAAQPFDVVDFPEWGAEGYVHLLNRTEWYRMPTVIHLHGPLVMFGRALGWPEIDSELFRVGTAMEGTCLRLADGVISSSACSADWCAREYGLDRDRIAIWHAGVDTRHFRPLPIPKPTRPTVVFVGKIAANKGVDLLVRAACRVAPTLPSLLLRLLGRGEPAFVANLHAMARRHGCPDLLDTPGFVDRQVLPEQLARAHVFAAPSLYEGGPGFVYLEAMACGLPVIACSGSGAEEVVQDGETGCLVPPGDVEALAAALHRVLVDAELRDSFGKRARSAVEAEADTAGCMRRLETHYVAVQQGAATPGQVAGGERFRPSGQQ